jgi:uncharacterized Rmd1/YagE family protein
MYAVIAIQISNALNIRKCKQALALPILFSDSDELFLEKRGKLTISGKKLKQFIGHVLKIKNQISENLCIFDSPDITWENEALNKLHASLKQTFDLNDRYRYIHERVGILKEDLELFKDIMDHRESSKLEWIIILLILVEVVDVFAIRILELF